MISSPSVTRQVADQLMYVLADAGAGAQRRPVIDDDPHPAEPITTVRPFPCWSTGWKQLRIMLKSPDLGAAQRRKRSESG